METTDLLTPEQFKELSKDVKLQLLIDGHDVYVTGIEVYNGKVKVSFFCKDQHQEEALSPFVYDCILKLIKEQEQSTPRKKFLGIF